MYKILLGIPAMDSELIIDKKIEDEESFPWTDFEVGYKPEEDYYYLEFETFLGFNKEHTCRDWIIHCCSEFTKYMESHGYDTSKELDLYNVFTKGVDVNTHFESLEDAYAFMKMVVFGFHGKGLTGC